MKATDLFNSRKEEFETVETFVRRVYETARRVNKSLMLTADESSKVVWLLAKYYGVMYFQIVEVIRNIEHCTPSKRYRIQWVRCLGDHYLDIERRYGAGYSTLPK